jgi:hypothetical protein
MIEVEVRDKEKDVVQFVIKSDNEFIRSGVFEISRREFLECIERKKEQGYKDSQAEKEAILDYTFYKICTS